MTLTAITKDLIVFNPSVLIESGESRSAVVVRMRRYQGEGLFCPHCYRKEGELINVNFRNSETRRPHFYHLEALEGAKECVNHTGESEKHDSAKSALAERLQIEFGQIEVSKEYKLKELVGLHFRKPDVLVTRNDGTLEAHEIQISPISLEELEARTRDLLKYGCSRVTWYLSGAACTQTNREWIAKLASDYSSELKDFAAKNVACYRLWFVDNDPAKPRWKFDSYRKTSPTHSKTKVDVCGNRGKYKATPIPIQQEETPKIDIPPMKAMRIGFPKIGSACEHTDPRVSWRWAIVVGNPETNKWDCVPGMLLVKKSDGKVTSIPTRLLQQFTLTQEEQNAGAA